jgi:transposase InsO family protein
MLHLRLVLVAGRAFFRSRSQLALENLALRHQLAVLKRSVPRPRIEDRDRRLWILLRRFLACWRDALILVQPDTVVRWHRAGFRAYWRRKSKPRRVGRPPIPMRLVCLIQRLSRENATWGAPRIHDELALLGHDVAESTVARYMVRTRPRSQAWRTFIRNHLHETAACDFFVVPTVRFRLLYVFVVLSLDRRRILHVNVTTNPTAPWTARQLYEAFPGDRPVPRYLMRDRDGNYGWEVEQALEAMGITSILSSPRSPWQNPYAERVIGTLRRECTDHVIPWGEVHLLRVLREYVGYYNEARTHQGLDGDAPDGRAVESGGEVVGEPVLGGLHHRYLRAS